MNLTDVSLKCTGVGFSVEVAMGMGPSSYTTSAVGLLPHTLLSSTVY